MTSKSVKPNFLFKINSVVLPFVTDASGQMWCVAVALHTFTWELQMLMETTCVGLETDRLCALVSPPVK